MDRPAEKEKKLRVLMIGPDRSVHGGISGVVNNYYEAGLAEKIELRYVGTMKEGSRLKKLLTAIKALLLFTFQLPKYDIVHVNVASDASFFRKSFFIREAGFFHKKIVIHQHGGDFQNFYHNQLSEKQRSKVDRVLNMGDAFLVLAPAWKEFFETIVDAEKIIVLPDAITIPGKTSKKYGVHKLLFLGRLCKEKGIGELMDIFPDLAVRFPEIKLYLGGIWEDEDLKKRAEEDCDHIKWLGWITGEEKRKYLEECDIFVLPSYFEGQSVSLLEAMAWQCACVASNTGGIPQMIEADQTGILVEPKNADSLKKGLLRALEDPGLCSVLGATARSKAEEHFSMEQNMEHLLHIYRGL